MTNEELAENHARLVRSLRKDGAEIVESIDEDQARLLANAINLGVWHGEVLDALKKLAIYRKPMTPEIKAHVDYVNDHDYCNGLGGVLMLADLDPTKADLLHMAVGVFTEAAELLDAVAEHVVVGFELDRENVIEELGDLEFYMRGIRQILRLSRDQCLSANICKLTQRYPAGEYTNKDAIERKDKA